MLWECEGELRVRLDRRQHAEVFVQRPRASEELQRLGRLVGLWIRAATGSGRDGGWNGR